MNNDAQRRAEGWRPLVIGAGVAAILVVLGIVGVEVQPARDVRGSR